jgi:alpha 1,2-mannosyltransferase
MEMGIMLCDKLTHGETLLLAAYYHWYEPDLYHVLLGQGTPGEIDNQTFLRSAMVLRKPFYAVHSPTGVLGRQIDGTFHVAGLTQGDPVEDYLHQNRAAPKTQHAGEINYDSAHPLFIYYDVFLPDQQGPDLTSSATHFRDGTGHLSRALGQEAKLVDAVGYDVERALWDELIKFHCGGIVSDRCRGVKSWYLAVFEGLGNRNIGEH